MATITDCILTKIGLQLGLKEENPIYSLIKEKISIDTFLASGIIAWFFLFLFLLIVFRDSTFLLLFSMGAFFCVISNAFAIWSRIVKVVNEYKVHSP